MYALKRQLPTQRNAVKKPRRRLPAHARAASPFRLPTALLAAICVAQLLILTALFCAA